MTKNKAKIEGVSGFTCPTCGTPGMVSKSGECQLSNGAVIPDVLWEECLACGEKLFDGPNTDKIVGFRKLRPKSFTRSRMVVHKQDIQ